MSKNFKEQIADVIPEMVNLRRQIHAHPEPAFEEHDTGARIVASLESVVGIEITTGVGTTGVVAVLDGEKKGPCIALRADMDCLHLDEINRFSHASKKKGLMHGCGHDGHVAGLVGAARVLAKRRKSLAGPVKFIFQPGEENAGGAREVIVDGGLDDPKPTAIFGLHGTPSLPLGMVGVCSGPMMAASRYFTITVKGTGTHAAMPHKGVDTVLAASQIVCAAHTIVSRNISPMEAALISIPKFSGSRAPNVLPSEVTLEGTLRALSNTTRDYLEERLRQVVCSTAESFGARAEIVFEGGYPLLENDSLCHEYLVEQAAKVCGLDGVRTDYPPSLGAEDFAFYLEEIPGAFCWFGLGVDPATDIPLHNPCFDFNDDAIGLAIELHCRLALGAASLLKQSA